MITENRFDKSKLISELKEIHIELVEVYKKIFDFKYRTNEDFEALIDKEYKENKISSGEQQVWNDNFCHRASYTLLNKILFIRICEDKGFMLNPEDYVAGEPKDPHIGKKLSRIGLQKWANLVTNYTLGELVKLAFLDMKKSYGNIALYKDDKYEMLTPTTEELSLKYLDGDEEAQKLVLQFENALSNIVEKLDTNNYNFNNTDGNILGDVYEKFMDRETRKAIGQFYTPEFVIEYILNNTVAKADVVENPFVSVADISCGSGHFLIMAYDILREKFINNIELLRDKYSNEVYKIKKNGREEELTGRDYWTEEHIHYHLLKHCIYGADIDSFAVQLTTINLLLKDLDNFTDELNIIECDSLIKWEEDYDWQDLKEQLELEFETVEYSQVNLLGEEEKTLITEKKETYGLTYKDIIGNKKTEKISKEMAEEIVYLCKFWSKKYSYVVGNPPYGVLYNEPEYAKKNYYTARNTLDTYGLFIERAIDITKEDGKVGFIVPNSWQTNTSFKSLREYILKCTKPEIFVNLPYDVFEDAYIDTVIFTLKVISINSVDWIYSDEILTYAYGKKEKIEKIILNSDQYTKTNNSRWIEDFDYKFETLQSEKDTIIISEIEDNSKPLSEYAEVNRGVTPFNLVNKREDNNYKLAFDGQLTRYKIRWDNQKFIDYRREKIKEFKDEKIFMGKRILLRVLISRKFRLQATLVEQDFINNKSIQNIIPFGNELSAEYLLAVINSKLMSYYINKRYATVQKDDFPQIFIKDTRNLPIKKPKKTEIKIVEQKIEKLLDLNYKVQDVSFHSCLTKKTANDILNNFKELDEYKNKIVDEINLIDTEIDNLIYIIYGLDKNQIMHIENFFATLNKKNIKEDEEIQDLHLLDTSKLIVLYDGIYNFFTKEVVQELKEIGLYEELDILTEKLKLRVDNFEELMKIMRLEKSSKNSKVVIKEALNTDVYTWNAYRKAKKDNKVNKTFIKYYDNNYYGLAEWSDEIHKKYFLDVIEEYTVNNPNEKKAKDILKLFKDLDIEDKEDYIEVIEEKIRKTFK